MSAALQLNELWATQTVFQTSYLDCVQNFPQKEPAPKPKAAPPEPPPICWAFYRKHTENLLRRYLYASMQIGRTPDLLADSVERGWASSRNIRTFEDALIFVLDVENCLKKLKLIDIQLIGRIVVQEYTHAETAALLGISLRTVTTKLPQALDHLTEALVDSHLLTLPD
jgi:hypothetical protein